MTTITQVRKAVQPLLLRHEDLALVGRFLIVTPVHHIVRGVYIDSSGDRRVFAPRTDVNLMFVNRNPQAFGWGTHLRHPCFNFLDSPEYESDNFKKADAVFTMMKVDPRVGSWDFDNPNAVGTMLEFIQSEALPILRSIDSLNEFVSFVAQDRNSLVSFERQYYARLLTCVATGDLETAREIFDRQRQISQFMDATQPSFRGALFAGNLTELAKTLHETEAKMAKELKLEKYWERTAFPIESDE